MPSDVLEWLPQARLCLPFALHPPCFDQGLCLGFPAEQGLDKQALGDVAVGNLCSFPLSLSHVGAGIWKGVERGCTCRRVTVFPATSQCSTTRRGPGTGSEAWVVPQWHFLGARAPWARLGVGRGLRPLGGHIISGVLSSEVPPSVCWPVFFPSLCGPRGESPGWETTRKTSVCFHFC